MQQPGSRLGRGMLLGPPMPTWCGAWEGHLWAGCLAPGLGSIRVPGAQRPWAVTVAPEGVCTWASGGQAGAACLDVCVGESTFWREQGQLAVSTREPEAPPEPPTPGGALLTLAQGLQLHTVCRGCVLPGRAPRTWGPASRWPDLFSPTPRVGFGTPVGERVW